MVKTFNQLRLIVVILITIYLLGCSSDQEQMQPSSPTLDFSLKTIEGDEISLKDYRGDKAVHLVFWSTWCPTCLMEMPKLKKLWETIGTSSYEILAVNVCLNESRKRIMETQKKHQIPFKIVLDKDAKMTKGLGVIGIPYHIIIDKEGVIKDRFNEIPEDPLSFLSRLFAGKKTG